MRNSGMLALLLSLSSPALAADYAVFAPKNLQVDKLAERSAPPAEAAVVDRARQALQRRPAPLATVHIEGALPGQGIQVASIKALQDLPTARDLAIAWRLTGDRRYLEQAERYLSAWAGTYQLSMNPIDETGFEDLILAYDLAEEALTPGTRHVVDTLLRHMATDYLDAMETGKVPRPQTLTNNWQSHRIKLATLASFQLGEPTLIARSRAAYERQIAANLRADGSVLDFGMRDALHYVVYDLEPLLTAAYAAKVHGQDWYRLTSPEGANLPGALNWLLPYARGEKTHVEFARSVVPFDRQRREAGLADYQNDNWKPAEAANLFALASLLDPSYVSIRDQLLAIPGAKASEAWLLLGGGTPQATGQVPAIAMMATALRSTDLEGSTRFYTQGLGMTVAGHHQTAMYDELILGFGGSRTPPLVVLLKLRSGKLPPARITQGAPEKIILTVADADALAAKLKAAGYGPTAVQHNAAAKVKQFFVSDPDGNRFEITERQADR